MIIDTIIDAGAKSPQQILDALRDGQALAALEITDSDQQALEDAYAMVNARQGRLHYRGKDGAVLSADLSNAKADIRISMDGGKTFVGTPYTTADAGHDESRMIELVNRWLLSYAG